LTSVEIYTRDGDGFDSAFALEANWPDLLPTKARSKWFESTSVLFGLIHESICRLQSENVAAKAAGHQSLPLMFSDSFSPFSSGIIRLLTRFAFASAPKNYSGYALRSTFPLFYAKYGIIKYYYQWVN
jgi:hypothetical protein